MKRLGLEKNEDEDNEESSPALHEEEQAASTTDPTGPPKKKLKYTDPGQEFSGREISKLKETEAFFHSSLFRLQVNELLKEVSLKQKLRHRLNSSVEKLKKVLLGLPVGKEHKISDNSWLEAKGITVPFVNKPVNMKGTFQFVPPSEVRLCGSLALDVVVKPHVEADIVLQIPKEFFQPKDFLNQSCVRKQAIYLAVVASHLKKKKWIDHPRFSYHLGNPLKPVLYLNCKDEDNKSCKICLHTAIDTEAFKLSRFHVSKNNIRPRWFFEKSDDPESEQDPSSLPGTPFYNHTVLQSLCCLENDRLLERLLTGSDGVRHGLMLLKVWARQRQLTRGYGGFSSYLMSSTVAYLLMKKKLNKLMNSYQVFRAALLYLSKADWTSDSPSLCEAPPGPTAPTLEEFQAASQCVFVDRTGHYNLAYSLSAATMKRVLGDAKLTIESLDRNDQKNFDVSFMIPLSFPRKFDYIFHVQMSPEMLKTASEKIMDLPTSCMDFGGQQSLALQDFLEPLLVKALEDRILHLQADLTEVATWDVSESPYSYDTRPHLTFGLNLNASCAFNALDKGPLADTPEAKEFRDFWGNKSEMRRFKDGTIHEAVLWSDSSNQCDRRLICQKIVEHILARHCDIPASNIHYMGGQLDGLLGRRAGGEYGTGEEQSLTVLRAFDDVNRALRSLGSLPLSVHSVQGVHPVFRHADVFPPLPVTESDKERKVISNHEVPELGKALPPYTPALTVICMLEGSGKWPEHKEAMVCMKALLHIKMAAELKEKHLLDVSVHGTHVDILKEGFVFRLKLATSRELAVLRTVKTESGMVKFKDTEESQALERDIVSRPLHTHLLHGVQQDHPVFSASVRLCKRWLAAQMVGDFLQPEALELIVAHTFITPHPYSAPSGPSSGFLRFLHLLSSHNWDSDPLLVNLNKEFTDSDLVNVPKEFRKNRATLPSMCLCTPQDKQGARWTRPQPSAPFLKRLVVLAREALHVIEAQIMHNFTKADFKQIFRPSLQHFDLVIKILRKVNILRYQNVDSKTELPSSRGHISDIQARAFPVTEFNVCQKFFDNLKAAFGDLAMFFYDLCGGEVIGLVWKQQALERKDFQASHLSNRHPVLDDKEQLTLEVVKDAILDDIRVIGGGIVETIGPPDVTD